MSKHIDAIKVLIAMNILLFAYAYFVPEAYDWLALYFPKNPRFGYWQFVSNMFMHGNLYHILFNMYGLWAFGTPLEQMWGVKRFVLFYFLAGLGAGAVYTLVNYFQFDAIYSDLLAAGATTDNIQNLLTTGSVPPVLSSISREKLERFFTLYMSSAVGASGAIYGILVAFGMSFPNAKLALMFLPVPIPAKFFIPILIGVDLFSGVTGVSIFGGGIAHFAHVGGAVIGFLLMLYWRTKIGRPEDEFIES